MDTSSDAAVPPGAAPPGDGATPVGAAGRPPRVRIVLAEVAQARSGRDRTSAELAEQTQVGEALVRGLVRAQLALAVRLSMVVVIGLGALPLLFAIAPAISTTAVLGIKLPWLLLGFAAYPFLLIVGWAYVYLAERNEQDFTALVQRPER